MIKFLENQLQQLKQRSTLRFWKKIALHQLARIMRFVIQILGRQRKGAESENGF